MTIRFFIYRFGDKGSEIIETESDSVERAIMNMGRRMHKWRNTDIYKITAEIVFK